MTPRPSPELDRLRRLAGSWQGAERIEATPWDPYAGPTTARFENRMACDGQFLVNDYEQMREGVVSFSGHGVYGWDPIGRRYTMHWFDSLGGDPGSPILGTWTGDRLEFLREGPEVSSRFSYTLQGDDRFTLGIEIRFGPADWQSFLRGEYHRLS